MASSRYHPLYDGLWDHPALEGAPFEEKGLFVFLFGNERQRPSGIYRMTDEQIVALTGLPIKRVRSYLADLHARRRIVRDGSWVFVRGYFARQPNAPQLLRGVESDIASCTSCCVLKAFAEKYQKNRKAVQWVTDRLATIEQWSGNHLPPEQLQSRAVQSRAEGEGVQGEGTNKAPAKPSPGTPANGSDTTSARTSNAAVVFRIPATITQALDRMPLLGPHLRDPAWWQAEIRAHPAVDFPGQLLLAESWCLANPDRAPKKRHRAFLHRWFSREEGR